MMRRPANDIAPPVIDLIGRAAKALEARNAERDAASIWKLTHGPNGARAVSFPRKGDGGTTTVRTTSAELGAALYLEHATGRTPLGDPWVVPLLVVQRSGLTWWLDWVSAQPGATAADRRALEARVKIWQAYWNPSEGEFER